MCRWLVFLSNGPPAKLGDVLSKPRHSLISQSYHASYHPGFSSRNNALLNADGFGCAWYSADGRLFLYKSGLTDSEHAFALLLTQLGDAARTTPFAPAELSAALVATIAQLLELLRSAGVTGGFTSLNFALTDGATVVATRFCDKWPRIPPPSLYCALPTCVDLEQELAGPPGAAAPGDGSGACASAGGGGGGSGSGVAAPDSLSAGEEQLEEAAFARRASRWAACEAHLEAATPTIASRALLIASEPATEGASSRVQWLAMPANALVSFTLGSGAAPALCRLEDLLSPPSGSGAAAGAMDRH